MTPQIDTEEEIRSMRLCGAQENDFKDATKYLSNEAAWHVLDSLACMFHNQGYALQGNTEHNDAKWLADCISRDLNHGAPLDRLSEGTRSELIRFSEAAIKCLPVLTDRISHRYINMSKAVRLMSNVAHRQVELLQKESR